MVPDKAAAMPKRPLFKMFIATLKPPPTSPSTHSAGTRTLSKYTSAVLDALIPIFFSGGPLKTTEGLMKKSTDLTKSRRSNDNSLCHTAKTPLHDEGCDLVLHLPRLGVLHGRLGEHREDLSQPAIAEWVETNQNGAMLPPCGKTKHILMLAPVPDPDFASIHGVVFSAGWKNGGGLDGGGIRTAGWFRQAEGCNVLPWKNTHTQTHALR